MKKNQEFEISLYAERPIDAKQVSLEELELIGSCLSELLIEMLHYIDFEE